MRRIAIAMIGVTACLLAAVVFYLHFTGRFAVLHRIPEWKVAVNGVPVDGEMLAGRTFAVVTRRDPGKEHSYLVFFEGDVDATGDTGRVIDCRTWIAPRLPILIETRSYPNCQDRLYATTHNLRMALTAKGGVTQFRTTEDDVISILRQ